MTATQLGNTHANPTETRGDRFVRELAALKIPDPAARGAGLWLRLGVVLMVAGPALGVAAYFIAHTTLDPLVQRDAITIALGGIAGSVVGSGLFLRYSLTGFLRFWMARQSYDLELLADRLSPAPVSPAHLSTKDTHDGTDPAPR